jgi:hypothetical protein
MKNTIRTSKGTILLPISSDFFIAKTRRQGDAQSIDKWKEVQLKDQNYY